MAKTLLIGIIIILLILITIGIISTLILRADFIECENTESPWCPQFTCPSTNAATGQVCTGTLSPSDNCGAGLPAVRESNQNQKSS